MVTFNSPCNQSVKSHSSEFTKMCCNLPTAQVLFRRYEFRLGTLPRPGCGKMDRPGGKGSANSGVAVTKVVTDYVDRLSDEHRMLVVLKNQLYAGSWEPMIDDLQNRLAGKPYIFKLVNRIRDDIDRIEEMRQFEDENGVDLADYVELP